MVSDLVYKFQMICLRETKLVNKNQMRDDRTDVGMDRCIKNTIRSNI
jgi:hypothetical protein